MSIAKITLIKAGLLLAVLTLIDCIIIKNVTANCPWNLSPRMFIGLSLMNWLIPLVPIHFISKIANL